MRELLEAVGRERRQKARTGEGSERRAAERQGAEQRAGHTAKIDGAGAGRSQEHGGARRGLRRRGG
uniref:Uncharacterized protein n=1 Tax=Siphoviridae sp. ctKNZ79 TaxID=2825440 RepID=A0A8S5U9J1_9CAUD|nr:MAG TPA: hypothetical protein [Siphoviridae sp. ctKNZ79]